MAWGMGFKLVLKIDLFIINIILINNNYKYNEYT